MTLTSEVGRESTMTACLQQNVLRVPRRQSQARWSLQGPGVSGKVSFSQGRGLWSLSVGGWKILATPGTWAGPGCPLSRPHAAVPAAQTLQGLSSRLAQA